VQNALSVRIENYLYSVLHPRDHNQRRRWIRASAWNEKFFFFFSQYKKRKQNFVVSW